MRHHIPLTKKQSATIALYNRTYPGYHSSELSQEVGAESVSYTLYFHGEPHARTWFIAADGATIQTTVYNADCKLVQVTGFHPVREEY